jgi:type I restriction enzyme S subunit
MRNGKELPRGWCWATLSDLAYSFLNGFGKRRQESGTPTIVLRLADITDGAVSLSSPRLVNATADEIEKYKLSEDDLLAIRVNGSPDLVGRLVRFTPERKPALFCDHFIRVRLGEPGVSRYLRLFADTPAARNFIDQHKVCSAGQNTISQSTLERLSIPLPPFAEQIRITTRADELLSDLDAGVSALERARANLKKYRAAVLKAAVTGELTADWRAAHPHVEPATELLDRILVERPRKWEADQQAKFDASGKTPPKGWQTRYPEPAPPDATGLSELPLGWCWASVEQVSEHVQYGSSAKANSDSSGVPVARMGNIRDGQLVMDDVKFLPHDHTEFPGLFLDAGDLLFNRTNSAELVGKTAVYRGNPSPCSFASYLIAVRFLAGCSADLVSYFINSALGRLWVKSVASQQCGQANVNGTKLQALAIPLPPLAEQETIVAEVEQQLSDIAATEDYIAASLKRAGRLRQSILKEAFAGRLVPQDPADEPASALLDRIRQARTAADGTAPGAGKAPRRRVSSRQAPTPGPTEE